MSDSSPPENSSKQTKPEQPPPNIGDKIDALIAALTAINQANRDADAAHEKTRDRHEERMFKLERAGVIGLGIYCIFTALEWQTFNSERVTMENEFLATQTNVVQEHELSRRQADAAEKQVAEMQKEHRLDERAWVYPDQMLADKTPDGVTFRVSFKNTGKTPALNVSVVMGFVQVAAFIPAKDDFLRAQTTSAVLPGGSMNINTPTVSEKIIQVVTNGGDGYVFGTVWYDDVFTNHLWNQYCAKVGPDLKFMATTIHNASDPMSGGGKNGN